MVLLHWSSVTLVQTYLALAVELKSIFGECHSHARAVIHMSRQSDANAIQWTTGLLCSCPIMKIMWDSPTTESYLLLSRHQIWCECSLKQFFFNENRICSSRKTHQVLYVCEKWEEEQLQLSFSWREKAVWSFICFMYLFMYLFRLSHLFWCTS